MRSLRFKLSIALTFFASQFCATGVYSDDPKQLNPAQLRIVRGKVTDHKDRPIRGAAVEWGHFLDNRDARQIVRTDDKGDFRLETRRIGPDFRLGVSAAGFAPSWRECVIPKPKPDGPDSDDEILTIHFQLQRPVTLRGMVVDEKQQPIAGATVIAKSPTSDVWTRFSANVPAFPFPGPDRTARTDATGAFVIRNLPPMSTLSHPNQPNAGKGSAYNVSIKTPSGVMPRGKAFSKSENRIQIRRSYVFETKDLAGVVQCRVIDAKTEKPIRKFKVVRRHQPKMMPFEDEQGEFRVACSSRGRRYQFFVYALGYKPGMIHLHAQDPANDLVSQIELSRGEGLQVRIVDPSGAPISDATVVSGTSRSKTARMYWGSFDEYVDGHQGWKFVQRNTSGKNGIVNLCMRGHPVVLAIMAPGFARRFVTAAEQQHMMKDGVLEIPLQHEGTLHGRVVLNGQPESNASIRISRTESWKTDFGEMRADEKGRFQIGSLSQGQYSISVYQHSGSVGTVRLSRRVEVRSGETTEIELDNPDGPCKLSGKAAPFSLINVSPIDATDDIVYRHVGTVADADGYYKITGLSPGNHRVVAQQSSAFSSFSLGRTSGEVKVSGQFTMHNIGNNPFQLQINLPIESADSKSDDSLTTE